MIRIVSSQVSFLCQPVYSDIGRDEGVTALAMAGREETYANNFARTSSQFRTSIYLLFTLRFNAKLVTSLD
jgi:hypothetical protein